KAWGDKVILKDFYYNFARFEKLGIIGNNGTGKSTFIKLLMGLVEPDNGKFDIGETVRFGYFSQEGLQFDEQQKVIDVVSDVAENINLGGGKSMTASQLLQHFLFTPEQQHNFVYKLSGGELRKLYLCTVLMKNPNFLVLDEPTNDLDIQTLQVLEDYLQDFPGCVIVISHDRYFMDKVVDHILVFKGEGEIQDFPGNYTQFREWNSLKSVEQKPEEKKEKPATKDYRNNEKKKLSYKEKREFEALDEDITKLEQQIKDLEEEICSGKLTVEDLTTKSMLLPTLKEELDEKSMRWLELSELS
ncbi:MAG: ABC-F family ATP-binding cassette domain-containing protein, partial [Prevotella buccalis]|nr:ABC-F family ATP-binding cassette domain-containing protein [Hoylesella buccalis]